MKTKTIKINSLLLDLDNSRFPETPESQREALIQMVNLQGDRIVQLAKDIVENGLDPSENIIVYKDDDGNNIVVEGNRRLTTLKLLNQPEMIPSSNITNKIKKIIQTNPDLPDSLRCAVFTEEKEFEHWINLKHTGANNGAGRVQWTGQEVDRHKAKHGNTSYGNQLLTFIVKEHTISTSIKNNTQKLYITNINRLLDDPDVRKALSLKHINGELYVYQDKITFTNDMNKILTCMLETDEKGKVQFTVDRIKLKTDRAVFVSQLDIVKPNLELEKPWKLTAPETYLTSELPTSTVKENNEKKADGKVSGNLNVQGHDNKNDEKGNTQPDKVKKTVNANPNRNMLIPVNVVLTITDKKCSGIFKELKNQLKYENHSHSIAVMFRVFLDLSLQHYLNVNEIEMDGRKNGLHDKVVVVTDALKSQNKISGSQSSAIRVTSSDISKRSGALQQYVHNIHMFPDKTSLNVNWDNLEPLFKAIWS